MDLFHTFVHLTLTEWTKDMVRRVDLFRIHIACFHMSPRNSMISHVSSSMAVCATPSRHPAMQIQVLNKGLSLYNIVVFLPLYNSGLIVMGILCGTWIYDEFQAIGVSGRGGSWHRGGWVPVMGGCQRARALLSLCPYAPMRQGPPGMRGTGAGIERRYDGVY